MRNQNEKGLSGCVAKANERSSRKKYKAYCKNMVKGKLVPVSRLEWDSTFNTNVNDRDLREIHTLGIYTY
jgi:hypothetical protein